MYSGRGDYSVPLCAMIDDPIWSSDDDAMVGGGINKFRVHFFKQVCSFRIQSIIVPYSSASVPSESEPYFHSAVGTSVIKQN